MSYCRWSSDDFDCDLYAYFDVRGGYTIHVASNRIVGRCPAADWPGFVADLIGETEFVEQLAGQHAFMRTCERAPIGLGSDGLTYHEETLGAFRTRLEVLREAGYRFPDEVFTAIAAEEAGAVRIEVDEPES